MNWLKSIWPGLKDLAERTAATFVVTFLPLVAVTGYANLEADRVAAVAGLAAAGAVIKNAITLWLGMNNGGKTWQDIAERTAVTYVQAFLGLLIISPTDVAFSHWQAALLAAGPAALDIVKGYLGTFIGNPNTAAWLPGGAGVALGQAEPDPVIPPPPVPNAGGVAVLQQAQEPAPAGVAAVPEPVAEEPPAG